MANRRGFGNLNVQPIPDVKRPTPTSMAGANKHRRSRLRRLMPCTLDAAPATLHAQTDPEAPQEIKSDAPPETDNLPIARPRFGTAIVLGSDG